MRLGIFTARTRSVAILNMPTWDGELCSFVILTWKVTLLQKNLFATLGNGRERGIYPTFWHRIIKTCLLVDKIEGAKMWSE